MSPQRKRNKVNRILISRNKSRDRHILNEDDLYHELKKYGFKKYYPEELSLEEQIELFYDAEYVVGAYGSAFFNMIYSDQIKVLELFPIQEYVDPIHYFFAKSLGHSHTYWFGQEKPRKTDLFRRLNFSVNVSEVVALIATDLKP